MAQRDVGIDQRLDGIGNLGLAEGGAQDFAKGGRLVTRAAQRELVEFDALLVDAQDADMAYMMVPAGIDAT